MINFEPFRFWCQKVLPTVYDDSLSYYDLLCKVVAQLNDVMSQVEKNYNELIEDNQTFKNQITQQQNEFELQQTNKYNNFTDTIDEKIDNLMSAWNELKNFVDNYFNNLDVQEEINRKLDSLVLDGTMQNLINVQFSGYQNQLNVLTHRMDTFASLPDGSTAGNAELLDIRVSANGTQYSSAGEAVRGQVYELKSDLISYETVLIDNIFNENVGIEYGSINTTNGMPNNTTDTNWKHTDFIKVKKGSKLKYYNATYPNIAILAFYDANKNYLANYTVQGNEFTFTRGTFVVPENSEIEYVRCTTINTGTKVDFAYVGGDFILKCSSTVDNIVRNNKIFELSKFIDFKDDTINIFSHIHFNEDAVYDFSGNITTNGTWRTSSLFPIAGFKYISFRLPFYNGEYTISPIVFFDNYVDIIPSNTVDDTSIYMTTGIFGCGVAEIPSTAKYVAFTSTTTYESGFIKLYAKKPSQVIVDKNGNGDVFSIKGARRFHKDGENVNILLKAGEYEEVNSFNAKCPSVRIVGEDRDRCIIIDKTGIYKNSPLVINGNFLLANITFKMTLDNVGSWTPTYTDDTSNTFPGYALHIDSASYDESNQNYGLIKNCRMYSEAFPAVGMGTNKNQTIEFVDCIMERKCTNPNFIRDNWRGAFLCHNSNYENAFNQVLILKNNAFKSNYGYACHIRGNVGASLEYGGNMTIEAIGNTFKSEDVEYSRCKWDKGASTLSGNSFGNSDKKLNALQYTSEPIIYDNVFDEPIETYMGSLQNGVISKSQGWRYTGYLKPILGSEIIYKANTVGGIVSIAEFYDENKNLLSKLCPSDTSWTSGTYTIPNDSRIKYMRLSLLMASTHSKKVGATLYLK